MVGVAGTVVAVGGEVDNVAVGGRDVAVGGRDVAVGADPPPHAASTNNRIPSPATRNNADMDDPLCINERRAQLRQSITAYPAVKVSWGQKAEAASVLRRLGERKERGSVDDKMGQGSIINTPKRQWGCSVAVHAALNIG